MGWGPSVEIRLHFSSQWEEKLLCGSVEPSPATLIRVAFIFSNLYLIKRKVDKFLIETCQLILVGV